MTWPNGEPMESFESLGKRKATCFEYAWNGYIRLYEKNETKCECDSCEKLKVLNEK